MTTWTTKAGRVIDEDEAERMAAAFEADDEAIELAVATAPVRRPGRQRLPGTASRHSPKVEFRISEDLHVLLKEQARLERRAISAVARDATEAYLEAHRP